MAKVKIGDIVEIETKKGLVYAQYTHKHKLMGDLIHVFTKEFKTCPDNLAAIINGDIRFTIFFPLQVAVKQKIVKVIANLKVPEHLKKFPVFKNGTVNPDTKKVDVWWLWDGEKEWKIGKLNKEQRYYPMQAIWNDTLLIERIENEWRSENNDF